MPVKMKPTSQITARLGLNPGGEIQKFFTNRCAEHMDKYVPFEKGDLADYRIDGENIIYSQPYARYQYYGVREDGSHKIKNRNLSKHELASSYWDKKMVSAELGVIIKETEKKMRR